jgi:hypothetical protein
MNFLYYVVGIVFNVILSILYKVFAQGAIELNQQTLIDLTFTSIIAAVAFFMADILISKRKNS